MNQKMFYGLSLVGFFLLWEVFGFTTPIAHGAPKLQATAAVVETPIVPVTGGAAGIPVTAKVEPVWTEIVVFYGLIGLTAMFLVLALLSLANKIAAPYPEQKGPSSEEGHKN